MVLATTILRIMDSANYSFPDNLVELMISIILIRADSIPCCDQLRDGDPDFLFARIRVRIRAGFKEGPITVFRTFIYIVNVICVRPARATRGFGFRRIKFIIMAAGCIIRIRTIRRRRITNVGYDVTFGDVGTPRIFGYRTMGKEGLLISIGTRYNAYVLRRDAVEREDRGAAVRASEPIIARFRVLFFHLNIRTAWTGCTDRWR